MIRLLKETIDRLRYKIPLRPKQVQIEITNRCNMDCPMCQREDLGIELEHMSWSHFTKVVDKLGRREDITLTGWGEPFIHPRVFDMITYCKERGHKVMITSNGLFTKSSMIDDILKSEVDTVTFSIDSVNGNETVVEGHTSNKVYESIEAVVKGRNPEKLGVRLQATLHQNCENDLYNVIRYGARIGCDIINVGRLDRQFRPNLERPDSQQERSIFLKADAIARSCGIQLDWLQFSVSKGWTRFFYRLLKKKLHRSGQYCLKTFDYAYVTREGDVTPCCLLPNSKMGNLLNENLGDIWKNSKFNHFRENYRDTCGNCDLWVIDQVPSSAESSTPQPITLQDPLLVK
jgi:MoaA/NifB/PqqE/SkfB family radical SAM enzyme